MKNNGGLFTAQAMLLHALICNAAIFVLTLIGTHFSYKSYGLGLLRYYTEDSNLFAGIVSVLFLAAAARNLTSGEPIPRWIKLLRYTATCCLTVTFLVSLLILSPTAENGVREMMLSGTMLYRHTLCPLLSLASLLLFERAPRLERSDIRLTMLPTLLYAVVSLVLNLLCIWDGPYPFLHIYRQPFYVSLLWAAAILGGAYAVAWLLWRFGSDRRTALR